VRAEQHIGAVRRNLISNREGVAVATQTPPLGRASSSSRKRRMEPGLAAAAATAAGAASYL